MLEGDYKTGKAFGKSMIKETKMKKIKSWIKATIKARGQAIAKIE